MTAPFDRPDAPGRDPDAPQFDLEQHLGSLLVLQVTELQASFETEYGERPLVVADVYVIGPENGGTIRETFPEAWLFGTVLYSQLKAKKGRTVVAMLEQGEKRPGRKPPWRLNGDIPPAAEQAAIRAMSSRPDPAMQDRQEQAPRDPWGEPVQPQRQPAADAWGQQPIQQPATPPPPPRPADPWGSAPAAVPPAPWEQPAGNPPF